jgi:DNA-binding IclR family transcriptional regulator
MKVVNPLIERCLQLISLMAEEPRAFRLGEISDTLALPKSATHRLLAALCGMGWAEQDPTTGFYRLTLRLAIMGQRFLLATRIPDLTRPVLERLARESEELVRLAITEGERLSWVSFVQGRHSGLVYQPAMVGRVPLHVTANGKAWLCTLAQDDAVRIVLEDGFGSPERYGPNALRSVEALVDALKLTRARGWGESLEEAEPGIIAVAAPICPGGPGTAAVATCSVAGPVIRFGASEKARKVKLVIETANELAAIWPIRGDAGPDTAAAPGHDGPAVRMKEHSS